MDHEYRRFAVLEHSLAETWFLEAESHLRWELGVPVGRGDSECRHVRSAAGLQGFAKPAFASGVPQGAHEKIASDLAYLIGIPVPPVTLWRKPLGGMAFAISLQGFPQPISWLQAINLRLLPGFLANCLPILAAGYVFHIWIGDTDHHNHGENLIVDLAGSPERPAIAFIDHANSMTSAWSFGMDPLKHLRSYYAPFPALPKETIATVAQRVQNIPAETIEDIVRRIPTAFLSENRAALIIDRLLHRQAHVADFFEI